MRRLALLGAVALLVLSVSSTLAASANTLYRARVSGGGMVGGSSVTLLANGRSATFSLKVYHTKPATTVTATLNAGACGTATTAIAKLPGVKAPASGTAVEWVRLTKAEFATLKADLAKHDKLSVKVVDGTKSACGNYALVH